ncbi:polysaccharide biosynthesis/export family protein [Thermodesulfobacteriota bacterium]
MIEASPKEPTPVNEATKRATSRFKRGLSASVVKGSNVINVSFQHGDPQIVAQAVNHLVESFKLKHIEIFKNPRASFMEKQLVAYRQRLQESEKKLEDFKQKNRVFSLDQQRSLLLSQQSKFDISLKEAQRSIHTLQQKISTVTSQMQTVPKYELSATSTGKTKNIDDAQNKLLNLQIKEHQLLAKYDGSNRRIASIRKEIQLIEDYLSSNGLKATRESESLSKNSIYQGLENSLITAQTNLSVQAVKITALEQQLNQVNGELQDLDAHGRELRELERERSTNERNFNNYVTKLEDARTEEELDLMQKVNISVIQKAGVPLWPTKSKKKFNLLVGIILGIGSGLALAIFSEYCIGRGVCTPESVEKGLGLPILATVPYKEKNSRMMDTFKMMTIASLFLMLLLLNACSTAVKSPTPFTPRVVQEPSDSIGEYTIHGNEKLQIKFFYNPELNETVTVRPDGRISLQFAQDVMAVGLTPAELTDILTEEYSTEFVDPKISVNVLSYDGQMVFVDGEVGKSRQLNLHTSGNRDLTVSQAITLSGGLLNTARRHEVRVIRLKADKKPFVIPVNLNKVYNGTDISQDVVLQPYDIVYVPKSTISNINLWMRQYIYNNFPQGGRYYYNWWGDK